MHPHAHANADTLFLGTSKWAIEGLPIGIGRDEVKAIAIAWTNTSGLGWTIRPGFPPRGTWVRNYTRGYFVEAVADRREAHRLEGRLLLAGRCWAATGPRGGGLG